MQLTELKVGGIYKLLCAEDVYVFIDKKNEKYTLEELSGTSYTTLPPGTVLTFIKTITEIRTANTLRSVTNFIIPVFYHQDGLVITYSIYSDMLKILEEVIDETP